jgi:hypothetical protein
MEMATMGHSGATWRGRFEKAIAQINIQFCGQFQ